MVDYLLGYVSNWKVLLMSLLVNMVVIAITALLLPGITITDRRLSSFVLLAIGLGLLNTLVKPIFQLLTIRLLFITYGLNIIIINTILLLMMGWTFPGRLEVDSLFSVVLAAILIWSIGTFLDYMFGVLPPLGYMQALREEERK